MNKNIISVLFAMLATVFMVHSADVPYLTGRITDNAQILSDSTHKSLTEILKEHEIRTTNQVVLLTLHSLEGESIEDFANKVFNEWKIGQKDNNNGILIVVVPDERQMRIEVGYGLESTMTDLTAGRIIRDIMAPRLREGDFDGGITDGTLTVISILDGKDLPETAVTNEAVNLSGQSSLDDFGNPDMPVASRILIGAFIFGIIGLFTFLGIVTPGVGWFLNLFLIPFWAMFPIIVVGTNGAPAAAVQAVVFQAGEDHQGEEVLPGGGKVKEIKSVKIP